MTSDLNIFKSNNSESVIFKQSQHLINKNCSLFKKKNQEITCAALAMSPMWTHCGETCLCCRAVHLFPLRQPSHTDTLVALIYRLPLRRAENIGFSARVSCFRVCKGRCVLFTGHIRAPPLCSRTLAVVFFSCSILNIIHLKCPMVWGLRSGYILFSCCQVRLPRMQRETAGLLFAKALTWFSSLAINQKELVERERENHVVALYCGQTRSCVKCTCELHSPLCQGKGPMNAPSWQRAYLWTKGQPLILSPAALLSLFRPLLLLIRLFPASQPGSQGSQRRAQMKIFLSSFSVVTWWHRMIWVGCFCNASNVARQPNRREFMSEM